MESSQNNPLVSQRVQLTLPLSWYAVVSTVVRNLAEKETGSSLDVAGKLGGGLYIERKGQRGVLTHLIRTWSPNDGRMKTSDISLPYMMKSQEILDRVACVWHNVATGEVLDLSDKGVTFISSLVGSLLAVLPYDSAGEVKLSKHGNTLLGSYELVLFELFHYDKIQVDEEGRPYSMSLRKLKYIITIEEDGVKIKRGRSAKRTMCIEPKRLERELQSEHRPPLQLKGKGMER